MGGSSDIKAQIGTLWVEVVKLASQIGPHQSVATEYSFSVVCHILSTLQRMQSGGQGG